MQITVAKQIIPATFTSKIHRLTTKLSVYEVLIHLFYQYNTVHNAKVTDKYDVDV